MGKKIIAVIFGGNSTEYEVSLQSALQEMAIGITTQEKQKELQIILGLKIAKIYILLWYHKTVL